MIKNPKPMHPGEVLLNIYMDEFNLTQTDLANRCKCHPRKINEIVKEVFLQILLLFLRKFWELQRQMWVRMQAEYDLWKARQAA